MPKIKPIRAIFELFVYLVVEIFFQVIGFT
jgi:hypothetical protein